jgi:hypothetical protein
MSRIYAIKCGTVAVGDLGVKGGRRSGNGQRAYWRAALKDYRG